MWRLFLFLSVVPVLFAQSVILDDSRHLYYTIDNGERKEVWGWDGTPANRIIVGKNKTVRLLHELRRANNAWEPTYHIFLVEGIYSHTPVRREDARKIKIAEWSRYSDPDSAPEVTAGFYDRYHRNIIDYHADLKTKFHREIGGVRTDAGAGRRELFRFPSWPPAGSMDPTVPDSIVLANSYRRAVLRNLAKPEANDPPPQTPKFQFTVDERYIEVDVMLIEKSATNGNIDNRYHLRFLVQ